ncbi:phospholipase D-like domain-containing protein [Methanococcoides sp. AM1]|uniref:phospholipase D-like domain-containing protein n=1 Tax=Methanococcoides sp. AM1 TaxID=1201011 RepID=UPI00108230FE|nr:restriction endonuclease PLD domain-containing protein [Methanococcoides sp. AM1]
MTIKFIDSISNDLNNEIPELFDSSDKVSIAVAFLKNSGLDLIKQSIKENTDTKISIITGLDFSITDVEALRELLDLGINCSIVHGTNFHPKLYIFENEDDNATIIVGSSNLSEGGFSTNYEANLMFTGKASESPIKNAIEYFKQLDSESVLLDDEIIKLYSENKTMNEDDRDKANEKNKEATMKLNEYLNSKVDSESLNDDNTKLWEEAESLLNEGQNLYEMGDIEGALHSYQKSYEIFSKLVKIEEGYNHFTLKKIHSLIGISKSYSRMYMFENAQKPIDEAEKLAKILKDDILLLDVLVCSIDSRIKLDEINKKCDEFIHIYESDAMKLEYTNYYNVGSAYHSSAEYKLKNNKSLAIVHISNAIINYKKMDLLAEDWNSTINNCNIAAAYKVENKLKHNINGHEIEINKHLNHALSIAKNKLKSKYWEGSVRIDIANSYNWNVETCHHLKKAKKIFNDLKYFKIVDEIDELRNNYECK